jgi:hypothetical protein
LEGAKVAYILDGDTGGKELKKGLIRAGVPEDLIVSIGVSGVENLLERAAYLHAVSSRRVQSVVACDLGLGG